MRYILDSKELTELAKEVTAAAIRLQEREALIPGAIKEVFAGRGIQWCDDE